MKNFLHHLFLPRENNNYRPGLLHHKILLSLILLFLSAGLALSFVRVHFPSVLGTFADISNQQLLILTNQQRQNNSLPPLTENEQLDQAAASKAVDMFNKNYWAHNAPDGTTPWVFIRSAGYSYVYAGENLARGFTNAQDVVNAWMASPEHRKNVLSTNYQNVGFAVATGKLNGEDTVLVVEMLGSTSLAPLASGSEKTAEVAIASGSPTINATEENKPSTPTATGLVSASQLLGANALPLIKPLINSQTFSLTLTGIVLFAFILVLALDMIVIERRKIVRFVGHNLDHVIFFSLMLIIVLILMRGVII